MGKSQVVPSPSLALGKLQVFKLAKEAQIVNAIMVFICSTTWGQQDHLARFVQALKAQPKKADGPFLINP